MESALRLRIKTCTTLETQTSLVGMIELARQTEIVALLVSSDSGLRLAEKDTSSRDHVYDTFIQFFESCMHPAQVPANLLTRSRTPSPKVRQGTFQSFKGDGGL
jgi:hypothetical protein